MTSEFELPCAECETPLVRSQLQRGEAQVEVAECPECGGRYYPERALDRL